MANANLHPPESHFPLSNFRPPKAERKQMHEINQRPRNALGHYEHRMHSPAILADCCWSMIPGLGCWGKENNGPVEMHWRAASSTSRAGEEISCTKNVPYY